MADLSNQHVRAFLRHGTRTGHLATVRDDGRAHVAPVWFALDGDTIVWNTGRDTVKGRNLSRRPQASLSVDDSTPPYAFVIVEGTTTLIEDLDEVRRWATRIGGRYMGPDRAEEFGARNGVPGELLVRLHPTKVIADFAVAE